MDDIPILIGLDGGATKFAAYEVLEEKNVDDPQLSLGLKHVEEMVPVAIPVAMEHQLKEQSAPDITTQEINDGMNWIQAAARTVAGAAGDHKVIRLGVCMPGVKTADRRGISVLRNGPRMPRFAQMLEEELTRHDILLLTPIARLIGDGEACGLGEQLARGGLFRAIGNAYYVGGGTGVAEAMLVDGSVNTLDSLGLKRAWELNSSMNVCFEDAIAQKHMNARYEKYSGRRLCKPGDLECCAICGGEAAVRVFAETVKALAELIRIRSESGRPRALYRVVLGQHTGRLFNDPRLALLFREPLIDALWDIIGPFRRYAGSDYVVGSDLRAAPAIGAASTAL